MNYKSKRGGARPGSGRPYLDGSRPHQGQLALKKTVTLPAEMVDFLAELGGGNLSEGIRIVTEYYQKDRDK